MAIRPRGNTWQVDLTVQGKRLPRYAFPTKKEAEAWEAAAKSAALNGAAIPCPKGPSDGTSAKPGSSRKSNSSENTLAQCAGRTYTRFWAGTASGEKVKFNMQALESYFGADKAIGSIDTEAIDGFVAHCIGKGNSNGTINRKLACLSKILRFAHDRGLIVAMPKLERKKENSGRIRWLTVDEEKALLDLMRTWAKDEQAEVVAVLIDTGMRPSEVYALTSRDVDLKAKTVTTWENKTDHPRTVYMTKRVLEVFTRRVGAVTAPGERLFPYDNAWLRYVWDRARVHLGFANDPNFVPYICRHTCASRLVQRGVAINVVKEWLGHKSVQMTMRYAHLAPSNLRAAADALEDA